MSTVQGLMNKTKKVKARWKLTEFYFQSLSTTQPGLMSVIGATPAKKVGWSSVSSPVPCSAVVDKVKPEMRMMCHIPLLACWQQIWILEPLIDPYIQSIHKRVDPSYMYLCKNGCWSALTHVPRANNIFSVLHQTMRCILTYPHLNLCFIICAFEFNLFLHLRRARRYLTPPNLHKWRGASDAAVKPNLLQIFAQQIHTSKHGRH